MSRGREGEGRVWGVRLRVWWSGLLRAEGWKGDRTDSGRGMRKEMKEGKTNEREREKKIKV